MTTLRQRARREERWVAESAARNGAIPERLERRDGSPVPLVTHHEFTALESLQAQSMRFLIEQAKIAIDRKHEIERLNKLLTP